MIIAANFMKRNLSRDVKLPLRANPCRIRSNSCCTIWFSNTSQQQNSFHGQLQTRDRVFSQGQACPARPSAIEVTDHTDPTRSGRTGYDPDHSTSANKVEVSKQKTGLQKQGRSNKWKQLKRNKTTQINDLVASLQFTIHY